MSDAERVAHLEAQLAQRDDQLFEARTLLRAWLSPMHEPQLEVETAAVVLSAKERDQLYSAVGAFDRRRNGRNAAKLNQICFDLGVPPADLLDEDLHAELVCLTDDGTPDETMAALRKKLAGALATPSPALIPLPSGPVGWSTTGAADPIEVRVDEDPISGGFQVAVRKGRRIVRNAVSEVSLRSGNPAVLDGISGGLAREIMREDLEAIEAAVVGQLKAAAGGRSWPGTVRFDPSFSAAFAPRPDASKALGILTKSDVT